MIDTLTAPERIALRAAVTARLNSAEDADLVGFACDLGIDVPSILADATEPQGKRAHMADKGQPMPRVEPVGLGWAPALSPDDAQVKAWPADDYPTRADGWLTERRREAQGDRG